MVLHDVTDDAELVEVAAAPLGVDVLLPRDVEGLDVLLGPDGVEECAAGDALPDEVLNALLGQVVIQAGFGQAKQISQRAPVSRGEAVRGGEGNWGEREV